MNNIIYMLRLWMLLSLMFYGLKPVVAQQPTAFFGVVTDSEGKGLPYATVRIDELNLATLSDDRGYFAFASIRSGNYTLLITYVGYESFSKRVNLPSTEVYRVTLNSTRLELFEVVIRESLSKTSRNEQSMDIVAVDKRFLQNNSGQTLMQLLDKIPGLSSINIGTGISKPGIRGLSFNRVVVTENGIKQEGQQWGADHGLEIDPNQAERIEVIKGPASLLFGSDAIGGAISILPPAIPERNSTHGSVLAGYRSVNDSWNTSAHVETNRNDVYARLRISANRYADFKTPANQFEYNDWVWPLANGRLKNTAGRDLSANMATGIKRTWGISSLQASIYDQKAGFFAGAHGSPNATAVADDGDTRNIGLPYQLTRHYKFISNSVLYLGDRWLDVDAGWQLNHRQEHAQPHTHETGDLPANTRELDLKLQTLSLTARYHLIESDSLSWLLGLSAQTQANRRDGYQFLLPNYNTYNSGIFTFYKRQLHPGLFANAGLRADVSNLQTKRYIDNLTGTEQSAALHKKYVNVTGSAGISANLRKGLTLKTNLGTGYRVPTIPELSSNGMHHGTFRYEKGDSSLKPERSWQIDAGVFYATETFEISATPYLTWFPNFIFLSPTGIILPQSGQLYRYTQSEAMMAGVEASADFHVWEALHAGFSAEYVYSHDVTRQTPLPFIPPAILSSEWQYAFKPQKRVVTEWFIKAGVQWAMDQRAVSANEDYTDGYVNLQAGLGARLSTNKINTTYLLRPTIC